MSVKLEERLRLVGPAPDGTEGRNELSLIVSVVDQEGYLSDIAFRPYGSSACLEMRSEEPNVYRLSSTAGNGGKKW